MAGVAHPAFSDMNGALVGRRSLARPSRENRATNAVNQVPWDNRSWT